MKYSTLGKTGISVSAISFGAGPISTLMVGDEVDRQRATVKYALEQGINWFDTAATYGAGTSETNLGRVLTKLGATSHVHVATKVRLLPGGGYVGRIFDEVKQRPNYVVSSISGWAKCSRAMDAESNRLRPHGQLAHQPAMLPSQGRSTAADKA